MDLAPLFDHCESQGFPLGAVARAQFEAFGRRLYALNEVMNLTRVPESECAVRHFVDSLLIAPLIPDRARVLDLGTGPGFPAWPLACARPDLTVTALDSQHKMLRLPLEFPLKNLELIQARAEAWSRREFYDVVTGRALAPLPIQIELSAAWVRVGGRVIPFRTPAEADEAAEMPVRRVGLEWRENVVVPLPGTDAVRLFPVYEKVAPTPAEFPRPWARMKQRPIAPVRASRPSPTDA